MAKRRVYEIARQEGIPVREVIQRLRAAGVKVNDAMSIVDESRAREIRRGPDAQARPSRPPAPPASVPSRPSRPGARPSRPPARRAGVSRPLLIASAAAVGVMGVVVVAAVLIAGSSGAKKTPAPPRPVDRVAAQLAQPHTSVVAGARTPRTPIYPSFGASRPSQHLASPNLDGAALVFLVKAKRGRWLQVYLPSRPNGSMGWIKRSRVTLSAHQYSVRVELGRRMLTVWSGPNVIEQTSIGVGHAVTPTPAGRYYITELLKQPESGGPYGPYAFGLSVHSNVLHEFLGRDGILGMHGTNEPETVGSNVSHGCIRMDNAVVTRLARILPAGTPVRITRT